MRAALLTLKVIAGLLVAAHSVAQDPVTKAPSRVATFTDVTTDSGLSFTHRHFGTGNKYMPENMGSGVALFDANGDGLLDMYFIQGAPWSAAGAQSVPLEDRSNQLYLTSAADSDSGSGSGSGRGVGTLRKANGSELNDTGYGMGVATADIDRDGHQDVFVTNFGSNRLYRGLGAGRFIDETVERLPQDASNGAQLWSTGAGFFDADQDGDLDLYVVNYLDFSVANHKFCGSAARKLRSYCHPDIYQAQPDVFYRNRGDGTFENATKLFGFAAKHFASEGKGLAVLPADLSGNNQLEVFVANDSTRNLMFIRDDQRFREDGLLTGVGYSGAGQPEASMGIASGDVNQDGLADLLLTHLDQETNTLYLNQGDGLFNDQTASSGLGGPSLQWVGFGTQLFDMDLDGDLDLVVVNGHIIDNISKFDAHRSYLQPAQLFENKGGGRFVEVSERLGLGDRRLAGRAAVAADWDRDGDLDLVLTQNSGPALLLRNNLAQGRSVTLRFAPASSAPTSSTSSGTAISNSAISAPEGIGARITLMPTETSKAIQVRWVNSTTGYLSQPPREVVFAITQAAPTTTFKVDWPSGATTTHEVSNAERSQVHVLHERPEQQTPSG